MLIDEERNLLALVASDQSEEFDHDYKESSNYKKQEG
jgi:hypothetical protein